ncbi:MAG: 3-phosphoshikimate 1-carboxyvinyltransferase [Myxococcales bacterium]|nr:3-phosphoshikimate 1-carboxyvinyltransferase [Myxococcales bacterium]
MTLEGAVNVPGDKSIGHRALLFAALGDGPGRVEGLGAGGDLASTRRALGQLGVAIRAEDGAFVVDGVGLRGLRAPAEPIDCGNSGTTLRLLCGLLAGQTGDFTLDGDASLRRRPVLRVTRVLAPFGGRFTVAGDHPPLTVHGGALRGATVHTGIASAQVKSAALLAGLLAEGPTAVTEPARSRDHTERMLRALDVDLWTADGTTHLQPPASLPARAWQVPGDLSSAAFWLAAAALLPGSDLTIRRVGLNPTRMGFLDVLVAMGADVEAVVEGEGCGEPMGHVRLRSAGLKGARIDGDLALRSLDELPLVAVLGALAEGETVVADAAELRVKESDRIGAMAAALTAVGARIEARPDGWRIEGRDALAGGAVAAAHDHRVAMAMQVAGLRSQGPVIIDDPAVAAVSYPGFFEALQARLRGAVEESER